MGGWASRLTALTAAIAAIVALAPTPAHAAASERCYPRDSDGIATNTRIRVFVMTDPEYEDRYVYYACALRSGKRVEIADGYTDTNISGSVGNVRFAGLVVGYRVRGCVSGPACGANMVTLDMRTGRGHASSADPERQVTDFVVARDGSAAWIDRFAPNGPARVMRMGPGGNATLDPGPGVEAGSLALARDNTLYWTNAGQPRSAALAPPPQGAEPVYDAVAGHRRCFPRGARAIGASTRIRVFQSGGEAGRRVRACDLRNGRRTVIARLSFEESFSMRPVAFAGPYVAFGYRGCINVHCQQGMKRLDVRTGATTAWSLPEGGASDLVVEGDGSVAWIQPGAVMRGDPDGTTQLDAGPAIDGDSLAVSSASRLYWTNAALPRSAALD